MNCRNRFECCEKYLSRSLDRRCAQGSGSSILSIERRSQKICTWNAAPTKPPFRTRREGDPVVCPCSQPSLHGWMGCTLAFCNAIVLPTLGRNGTDSNLTKREIHPNVTISFLPNRILPRRCTPKRMDGRRERRAKESLRGIRRRHGWRNRERVTRKERRGSRWSSRRASESWIVESSSSFVPPAPGSSAWCTSIR